MEKRYDFLTIEKQMQDFWAGEGIYTFDPKGEGQIYSIDTPPPTVSGSLHIGHIFSYTQAEIIARFKRMNGFNVFYPFGFDDNGLPTERLVEREEKVFAPALSREEFATKCQSTVKKYIGEFKNLWQALGFCCDWNLEYDTVSQKVQALSQKMFLDLIKSGRAYRRQAPILWCTTCQTSIAQAELEYKEQDSQFHTLVFKSQGQDLFVATTRPELLPSCAALLKNPNDARYKHLSGKAVVPLYGHQVPIIDDELVSIEKGSGLVMCCTFGDATDMEWVKKYDLPTLQVVAPNGRICEGIAHISGLKVKEARSVVVKLLQENGLLTKSENIIHNVATHDRCDTANEIISSWQWYISVLDMKKELLEQGEKLNWYPPSMKKKYDIWVENLKWDWCVSRQRFFGVPIPVWYCASCGKTILANEQDLPINPLTSSPKTACECGCKDFIPEASVLDTWATSSLTPQIAQVLAQEKGFKGQFLPMGMRTQAHEIIRTWLFYTTVRSLYHEQKPAWKDVMVCGFVLAKKGEKISKSKQNSVYDPKELVKNYSVDVIRYCAANAKLGTDSFFSSDELEQGQRQITKMWNASKFVLMQLQNYTHTKKDIKDLLPIDRWILEKSYAVMDKCKAALDIYEAGQAKQEIDSFFWNDFCDNYLEIAKDRLYKPELYGEQNTQSAQYALFHTYLNILKIYAIYTPHITEYVYKHFFEQFVKVKSLHLLQWESMLYSQEYLEFGDKVSEIMSEVRRFKTENKYSMREPIDILNLYVQEKWQSFFKQTKPDLIACTASVELNLISDNQQRVEIIKHPKQD